MATFSASAPGKIILLGEHAVVYHRPAIAVPVTQVQARCVVEPEPHLPDGQVRIDAADVGLNALLEELPGDQPLAAAVLAAARELRVARLPACTLHIRSTIPVASGLGSGAAVSVAVLRAISAFLGFPLADEQVCNLAYEIEKLHHGTPSGIDNTVVTYARPVYFRRGAPIETLTVGRLFEVVIGDTGIAAPTAAAVGDLRRLWQSDPIRWETLFDSVAGLVQEARYWIEAGRPEQLGPLMDQNHAALQIMRVSSPELDHLVAAARAAGALGAKLSGGGRGGNMIALVTPATAAGVAQALTSAGAVHTITTQIAASPGG
jgi:mevalonate kinase